MPLKSGPLENFIPVKEADRVVIDYYTDPLCCWSWAFEKSWQRFVQNFGDFVSYSYCMGGLIPDWKTYQDPMNAVNKPAQLGPLWMEAAAVTDTEIDSCIWVEDPPSSSYPACIAVKSAEMQSKEAGENYLFRLRDAVMTKAQNISKPGILAAISKEMSAENPLLFNHEQFLDDIGSEKAMQLFREDIAKVRYNRIGRFPTITMQKPGQNGIIITGYRPYEVFLQAFEKVAPELKHEISLSQKISPL